MFNLNDCIGFITNTASKKIVDEFNRRLKDIGITKVKWTALFFIGEKDGISQKELSQKMNVNESSIARLLDRMEREKLCSRVRDSQDRRIIRINLTQEGEALRAELLPIGQNFHDDATNGISQEELHIFTTVLDKMVHNLSKTH
ncbi:MarR family winged helix-turn-helix transcriptional regulator [Paenibacillus etheri]|uniref:MarR family transcriptional regulator n=1 Tax=Paenibacillus etheri TaxID=1306852 RepID=A0A0W1AQL7_9BACL|nr:MarR family transcriptional regulator [Paenibacillus etheri]KTD83576.1 MarR family transcriptional regulator [Paenibacillus etheri]